MMYRPSLGRVLLLVGAVLVQLLYVNAKINLAPRDCHGKIKHIHLAVGPDPAHSMTISFATDWAYPGQEAPVAGIRVGTSPRDLRRFVPEQEHPLTYNIDLDYRHPEKEAYYAPFQHHVTVDGLEPDTTYYYVAVIGDRKDGIDALASKYKHGSDQHAENINAEEKIYQEEVELRGGPEGDMRHRYLMNYVEENIVLEQPHWDEHGRRLAPPPYDPTGIPCIDRHKIRSFRTAPDTEETMYPITFGIIGDLGQFEHSQETVEHLRDHLQGIKTVVLVGDIAYPEMNGRKWDTFFDFLDDKSPFAEIPLQIAAGNHDIDKQPHRKEIFLAYEYRFRMPRVKPPQLGLYEGKEEMLNMDAPPYPLPYEWGNAYYAFTYGPARHVVVNSYSDMSPGSSQYKWLEKELVNVDRARTPWVLLTIHVPLYNTFSVHHHDPQIFAAREHLEPLMIKYNVNIVFNGHVHAYQRTHMVASNETTPEGTMHITIGAGGRNCDAPFVNEEPESWVAVRDASMYGYGRFTIYNETHAEWKWVPLSPSDLHDYNQVKGHDEVHLPSLDHDRLVIENQYYVRRKRELQDKQRRVRAGEWYPGH